MNRDEYIQEIALKIIEELNKLNKEQELNLLELLKNNVSLQILPMPAALAADEVVDKQEDNIEEIMELQKEILDRVICELQKKEYKILLN